MLLGPVAAAGLGAKTKQSNCLSTSAPPPWHPLSVVRRAGRFTVMAFQWRRGVTGLETRLLQLLEIVLRYFFDDFSLCSFLFLEPLCLMLFLLG